MLHQNENSFVVSDKEKREQRFLQMSVAESKNLNLPQSGPYGMNEAS
jgi:hypothetical protein